MKIDRCVRLLLIAVVILLLLNLLPSRLGGARAAGVIQYKYVPSTAKTPQESEAQLNKLGSQGWELLLNSVTFDSGRTYHNLFIKK